MKESFVAAAVFRDTVVIVGGLKALADAKVENLKRSLCCLLLAVVHLDFVDIKFRFDYIDIGVIPYSINYL